MVRLIQPFLIIIVGVKLVKEEREKNIKFDIQLNEEQKLAKEQILSHPFSFIHGKAGSGKTLLATATATDQLFKKNITKIVITRPTVATEDNGFLPGSIEDKLDPWLVPIKHNLRKFYNKKEKWDQLEKDGIVEIVALSHFRGRAQPLSSIIYTPTGCTTMGDVKIGDEVLCPDNTINKVIGVYPQGVEKVYKITFSDGAYTHCSENHLWKLYKANNKKWDKFEILPLKDFKDNIKSKNGKGIVYRYRVPLTTPIDFVKTEQYLHPYLMGLLIGDGCVSQEGQVGFTTADIELVKYFEEYLPVGAKIVHRGGYEYRIIFPEQFENDLIRYFKSIGFFNIKSINKFIPSCYKYSTKENRIELLKGLMDSDGSLYLDGKKYRMEFTTISEKLKDDIEEVVRSLGGLTYCRKRKRSATKLVPQGGSDYFQINVKISVNPFKLERKSRLFNPSPVYRNIISVEYLGEENTQCISIEHPDRLYLTDNFIVTHNTFEDAICIVDEYQNLTKSQLQMCIGRLGQNSRMIFCGDINQIDIKTGYKGSAASELQKLENCNSVYITQLLENHRHPAVFEVLELLNK